MLFRLGWLSLEQRREIAKTTMYKILHNMVAVPFDKYRAPILLPIQEATRNDFIKLQHT